MLTTPQLMDRLTLGAAPDLEAAINAGAPRDCRRLRWMPRVDSSKRSMDVQDGLSRALSSPASDASGAIMDLC